MQLFLFVAIHCSLKVTVLLAVFLLSLCFISPQQFEKSRPLSPSPGVRNSKFCSFFLNDFHCESGLTSNTIVSSIYLYSAELFVMKRFTRPKAPHKKKRRCGQLFAAFSEIRLCPPLVYLSFVRYYSCGGRNAGSLSAIKSSTGGNATGNNTD